MTICHSGRRTKKLGERRITSRDDLAEAQSALPEEKIDTALEDEAVLIIGSKHLV